MQWQLLVGALGASMLHSRLAADQVRPWRGVPPWTSTTDSRMLAANLEQQLGQEVTSPVVSLLPDP